ncbi:S-methyl-5'-thioadenosine phosphorylase [Alicyclobacillus sp. SO9]|uniref:S-methyl-5'-thioadenosine phosphorylase n=1 Tax=Alicyclobacillus sp. SO9 TaxID=2665646 RepID=UPI0018E7E0A8|nr:S-methyl-5'-thioadenosine phosphorylase [Alicyclobacillus sp. SO9]QQE76775.1 S-methyl-5'-thioadenosine phosphorylase [Alicyclobacillus sp. SO9]
MHADVAIIGGTGVYDPAMLDSPQEVEIKTPYGTAKATVGTYHGKNIAFMPRHGAGHSIPPHKINYRANIYALKKLGVTQVLATAAVGSLQLQYKPGSLVVVDDFLDFTKSRPATFFEEDTVIHVDVSDPYCNRLRKILMDTGQAQGIHLHDGGTYVCSEGPRFESPAEIKLYQSFGAAVIGMTSVPELILAKEAELCYATVCMVTNYGAGISEHPLTHAEVVEEMSRNVSTIRDLFFTAIDTMDTHRGCLCSEAVGVETPLTGIDQNDEDALD